MSAGHEYGVAGALERRPRGRRLAGRYVGFSTPRMQGSCDCSRRRCARTRPVVPHAAPPALNSNVQGIGRGGYAWGLHCGKHTHTSYLLPLIRNKTIKESSRFLKSKCERLGRSGRSPPEAALISEGESTLQAARRVPFNAGRKHLNKPSSDACWSVLSNASHPTLSLSVTQAFAESVGDGSPVPRSLKPHCPSPA